MSGLPLTNETSTLSQSSGFIVVPTGQGMVQPISAPERKDDVPNVDDATIQTTAEEQQRLADAESMKTVRDRFKLSPIAAAIAGIFPWKTDADELSILISEMQKVREQMHRITQ